MSNVLFNTLYNEPVHFRFLLGGRKGGFFFSSGEPAKTERSYWLTATLPNIDWPCLPEEGWAEVDGDAGEPDHEQPKANALRTVLNLTKC